MMEETELEEGEAPGYPDGDGDYTIDPDIAFSYIGEKVQQYLGHHQKDFEGGFSAANLGAKFNGYGSFLPTYQRSSSRSQINSPARADNYNFPRSSRKLITTILEDQKSHDGSGNIQSNHIEESVVKSEAIVKSVNPSEQKALKVRIKVGSENSSTQKNADLYSGLGLVVSPSSSLDGSPTSGVEKGCNFLREPDESPTSILEVMTSVLEELPMTPLPEDLIYLTERINFGAKHEIKNVDKTGIESLGTLGNGFHYNKVNQRGQEVKTAKSRDKDENFSIELKHPKNNSDKYSNASLLENLTEIDGSGPEELANNAFRLPFLTSADTTKDLSVITTLPLNVIKDGVKAESLSAEEGGRFYEFGGRIDTSVKVSEYIKENIVSDVAALPLEDAPKTEKSYDLNHLQSITSVGGKTLKASGDTKSSKQLLKSRYINEDQQPICEKSLTGGKMNPKVDQAVRTQGLCVGKDDSMIKSSLPQKVDISCRSNGSLIHTDPISSSGKHHPDSGNPVDELSHPKENKPRVSKSAEKEPSGRKTDVGTNGESKERKPGHDKQETENYRDKKNNLEHDNAKLSIHAGGRSTGLPPLARGQTETVANLQPGSRSQKENGVKGAAVDGCDNGDMAKAPNQRKRTENQNDQLKRHPTPNSQKPRNGEVPSPLRRDSSSHAANNALKEAKDLKHLADRFKDSGSTERTGIYFQSALKFLHGASLLESGCSEASKHGELTQAMQIYSSTGKLCEFCAREYEKSKDMAAAALAYKCMEVAYLRVVYSSQTSLSRDRAELQAALQIAPSGESPSSSASDIDNHQVTTDKVALAKAVGSPQVSGSHVSTSRNRSVLSNIINYAQDVNSAMEASRKSRIAFTAATSKCGEIPDGDGISSLERALDFNFQDVESLLRLVRVAMEAIGR